MLCIYIKDLTIAQILRSTQPSAFLRLTVVLSENFSTQLSFIVYSVQNYFIVVNTIINLSKPVIFLPIIYIWHDYFFSNESNEAKF